MRIIETEMHVVADDTFTFDDGHIITLTIDRFVWRQTKVGVQHKTDLTIQESFPISYLSLTSTGKHEYWRYADYIYYIVACHISYVRFYVTTGEWLDPLRTQFEYHPLNDIKHRCHNLRKAGKFSWAHYDILRKIDEYNEFAKRSRFGRESILNFYSRFLKLSILKNNKTLSWIIDETESFINYGFVIPDIDRKRAVRCGCKPCKSFGEGCPIHENHIGNDVFTSVSMDEADSWDFNGIVHCDHKQPHPTDKDLQCEHQQYYRIKTRYNKRVGVRQKTKDIVNMQLTDDQPFELNGTSYYCLYQRYKHRMLVKSKTPRALITVLSFVDRRNVIAIPVQATVSFDIESTLPPVSPLVVSEKRKPLTEYDINMIVDFLILNRYALVPFVMNPDLTPQHIADLTQVAYTHPECNDGRLVRFKHLMEKRKLMSN